MDWSKLPPRQRVDSAASAPVETKPQSAAPATELPSKPSGRAPSWIDKQWQNRSAPSAAPQAQPTPKPTLPLPEPPPPPPSLTDRLFNWLDRMVGNPLPTPKYQPPAVGADDFDANPPMREQHVDPAGLLTSAYGTVEGGKPIIDGISSSDPVQGELGDCHFVASLSGLAEHQAKLLQNAIEDKGGGKYLVTLYVDTPQGPRPVKVPITEQIPLGRLNDTVMKQFAKAAGKPFVADAMKPLYTRGADGKELWPALFEKAYAKWRGKYDELDGDYAARSLFALTGVKAKEMAIDGTVKFDPDALFKEMKTALEEKRPVLGATLNVRFAKLEVSMGRPDVLVGKFRDLKAEGFEERHQYTVKAVFVENGQRMVTLRDPRATTEYKKDLRPHQPNDGVFTIPYADFLKATARVCIAGPTPTK